jgi:glycosyltransferase involved in cell wall biosynthesis
MPKVTIIIPTYNSSRFIRRTIGSVIAQTFRDWELIIIDDCSKDNTELVVREFTKFDKRIKFLKTPENSGGPATPKNIGVEKAEGEYIAFLDHDDEWFPEKLEKQLRVFQNSKDENLGLVSCYINLVDEKTKKTTTKIKNFKEKDILFFLSQYNFFVTSSCIMIRKSVFDKVGKFDNHFSVSDDWDMWLRIIRSNYKVSLVKEFLVNYYTNGNNLSRLSNIEIQKKEFDLLKEKSNEKDFRIRENWFLGYYYFVQKKYSLSRKYHMETMKTRELSLPVRLKSLAYIILSFIHSKKLEDLFRQIWRKLK